MYGVVVHSEHSLYGSHISVAEGSFAFPSLSLPVVRHHYCGCSVEKRLWGFYANGEPLAIRLCLLLAAWSGVYVFDFTRLSICKEEFSVHGFLRSNTQNMHACSFC